MSATVETVAVEVVVREKKPTLPAKYTKNLVFGYWLIEKLHDQGLLSESTPAYELLQLFADVPTQISYMDEGFFEELSSLTKDMKAKIRAFHKPIKTSTKKTATGEDAPAKKRGRKKAVVIPPVLDEQSQYIADLVQTANPTKKQSALQAVNTLLNAEVSTIPTPKNKKNTNKKTAPVVTETENVTVTENLTGEEPTAVVPTPKNKKNTNKKTPADETVTVTENLTGEEPTAVVPTLKNKKTTNKKTPAAENLTGEEPTAVVPTPKTKKNTNKKTPAATPVNVEEPTAVVTTPKNKKNTNKKTPAATPVNVEEPKAVVPLEEGEVDENEDDENDENEDDDVIEASPFVFNQQHFLIDNNNLLYHPSSFLHLGSFDPILQIISLI